MSPYTRRRLLRAGGLVLTASVAGCLSSSDTPTATGPGFDTPPPGECEAVDRPKSGPTKGGLEPVEYPAYPEEVTSETARSFAADFEHAYRRNEFIERNEDSWYDGLRVDVHENQLTDERNGGPVVKVQGMMVFAFGGRPEPTVSPTPSPRPHGRVPFTAWFYLADRYVIRYENDSVDEPDFEYGEVVVCDE